MVWQYAAASVTGVAHIRQQLPCQDAWQINITPKGVICCVSDGAGSAAKSDIGSQTLVNQLCRILGPELDQIVSAANGTQLITNAIAQVRQQLSQQGSLSDFHATVCGLISTDQDQLIFHLGDGVILGINPDDWQDYSISEPENGEYADMTYFFTLPNWRQHLRIWSPRKPYPLWFLMSDGASGFAATSRPVAGPQQSFLKPVHQYLMSVSREQGEQALANTLQDTRASNISQDDKTLLWLYAHSLLSHK